MGPFSCLGVLFWCPSEPGVHFHKHDYTLEVYCFWHFFCSETVPLWKRKQGTLFNLYCRAFSPTKKVKNGSTHFDSGTCFCSYLALFHENGTTVSKRHYFSSSGVQFSTFFLFRNGPSFEEVELKWLLLRRWSHNQPFFSKVVLKHYLKGGHPMDMKMAPLWSHFDSTLFFQWRSV